MKHKCFEKISKDHSSSLFETIRHEFYKSNQLKFLISIDGLESMLSG